ncbi:MAG TPA: hypothetical protein VE397_17825 [Stellaceae bacterium]|nr:hypothetical protein [Stellaceae bacterium]
MALGGYDALSRALGVDGLVRTGDGVRNGGLRLSRAELLDAAARLEAASGPSPDAEEAGALTFLHYAAADAAAEGGDSAGAVRERAAARAMAVKTLAAAPTRADVSLALAELRFLDGKDRGEIVRPLLLSYETAPRELWIIERRIGLGLRLAATAGPDLMPHIIADIRTLGEPFRSTDYYRELAVAAWRAGPYAVALVGRELAPEPLSFFNRDLGQLAARPPSP